MTNKNQGASKFTASSKKKIACIKYFKKNKAPMTPRDLFHNKDDLNKAEKPSRSNSGGEKCISEGDTRPRVLTPQGKQVLTSDARLHLEKNQTLKQGSGQANCCHQRC